MTDHSAFIGLLLGLAVAIAIVAAVGMAAMRDTFQRLHFSALAVSLSTGLVTIAVWIDHSDAQARIKVLLTAGLLFVMNSILTHATARAARIRRLGHWDPQPDEQIALLGGEHGGASKHRRRRRRT